jgi:L-lactate utilization protein LutC
MNLFKKLFQLTHSNIEDDQDDVLIDYSDLQLDDAFVQNFIQKGGKFLYCAHQDEVNENLFNIINENNWSKVVCINNDLKTILSNNDITCISKITNDFPFFTFCEHLIADEGSIMFSSDQLREQKILELPDFFIVYAKTSQLVKNKSEALMGLRKNYKKDFPTNISSIKSYMPERVDEDFLNFGNNNAKSLYLLLLEDL